MTKTRMAALLTSLSMVVFAWAYWAIELHQSARVITQEDWKASAEIVRFGWQDGDTVVFSPAWALSGAPEFQGLDIQTGETIDWYVAGRHGRVWVVGALDGRSPALPDNWTSQSSTDTGSLTVHIWIPPYRPIKYDFMANLKDAQVTRVYGKKRENCSKWFDGQWHCGSKHPWQYVGPIERDIAGAVRKAIWFHPLDRNNPLEIKYREVPSGNLVVHYGLTQRAVEASSGSPVLFEIRVDGKLVHQRSLLQAQGGWFSVEIPLSGNPTHEVLFVDSTPNHNVRQLCFTADVRE